VKKEELRALMIEYADATITYRSQNSKKLKYNVCTIEFDIPHIQKKVNRAKETDDTLLLFCYDTDSYRLIKPAAVTSVIPMSNTLKNENI
jgi:hypothetical protein